MSSEFATIILNALISNDISYQAENIRRFLAGIPEEVMFGILKQSSDDERSISFYIRLCVIYLLCNMGIHYCHYGFRYLYSAILMSLESKEERLSVTKEIYPDIAKRYKVSSFSVERNIRYAISRALSEYKNEETEIPVKNYSNSGFISAVTEHIRTNYI